MAVALVRVLRLQVVLVELIQVLLEVMAAPVVTRAPADGKVQVEAVPVDIPVQVVKVVITVLQGQTLPLGLVVVVVDPETFHLVIQQVEAAVVALAC